MNALLTWLATILPGYKTKLFSAMLAGSGAVLTVLQYLQTIDLTQYLSPQTATTAMTVIGILMYVLRIITVTKPFPTASTASLPQ